MKRRPVLIALALTLLLGLAAAAWLKRDEGARRSQVRLSSFPAYGKDSPYFLALKSGFYAREGIAFRLEPTYAGALPPLHSGRVEIAQDLCSEIVRAIIKGAPLRIIAARDAQFPVATVALSRRRIGSPKDYGGKRWGTSAGATPEMTAFRELAEANGFDHRTVRIVNIPFNARPAAMIADEIDFASAWYGSGLPEIESALRRAGIAYDHLRWSDHGIDIYGYCLAARRDWLRRNPDLARAFLRATLDGLEAAIRDPPAAVEATLALNPNARLDREVVARQWSQSMELLNDDFTRRNGLLRIDPVKMRRTALAASDGRDVRERPFYTNEYLPR